MRKTCVLLISLLSSILVLSCASSKQVGESLTTNDNAEIKKTINKNCSPYHDKYLEFTVITNEIQKSKYEDKNIFKVVLDHGTLNLEPTEKYKNLDTTEEETEIFKKATSEISMFLKYLLGFYFDDLLTDELKLKSGKNKNLIYYEEYEWNNFDCFNYYIIEKGLVTEIQTYKKDDPQIKVDTKYKYKTINGKNYLLGFETTNNFQSFDFGMEIDYLEKDGILVPAQFTAIVKHPITKNGKTNVVTTKYKMLADNQIVR